MSCFSVTSSIAGHAGTEQKLQKSPVKLGFVALGVCLYECMSSSSSYSVSCYLGALGVWTSGEGKQLCAEHVSLLPNHLYCRCTNLTQYFDHYWLRLLSGYIVIVSGSIFPENYDSRLLPLFPIIGSSVSASGFLQTLFKHR